MKTQTVIPRLTLVGAGPGDLELFTLKGVKALQAANVVLYDALLDDDLLQYAPQARKIFVGKHKGQHYKSQQEINQLIISEALQHGHVVRLKGGDPFVFGRASEEILAAEAFGIPVSVIPGISSATAVPGAAGIPVTQRGISEGFWVITGTTEARQLSSDIALAAQSNATVVVLMGLGHLQEITAAFKAAGKSNLPVAVLQSGTTAKAKQAFGTVSTIVAEVAQQDIAAPAIIVLGASVAHRHTITALQKEVAALVGQSAKAAL